MPNATERDKRSRLYTKSASRLIDDALADIQEAIAWLEGKAPMRAKIYWATHKLVTARMDLRRAIEK